jgi:glutamyl-Q tRNA(Asp) synthetase
VPVLQSIRHERYLAALGSLAERQLTFRCRCSRRDIGQQTGGDPRYPGTCRNARVADTESAGIRLRVDPGHETFADLRHGAQTQEPSAQCGDLLLRDRLGQWTYQFAVVVDDFEQGVDVVIRGDDLLDSTGRQLLLARHLHRTAPLSFLHHPLVTHADGAKLSKSNNDTALAALRGAGWTRSRVLGHAAWLGGLQTTDRPIEPDALAGLWNTETSA